MNIRPGARVVAVVHAVPLPVRLALRQLPLLGLAVLLVALLPGRIAEVNLGAVISALGQLGALHWGAALVFVGISFWALGRYDVLVHRHLASGRGEAEAQRAGLVAIAVAQMAGFGLLTGALARLRMLPGLGLAGAVRITLSVTVLFLAGWAVVTAAFMLALAVPALDAFRPLAWAVVVALPALAVLSFLAPRIVVFGRNVRLPTLVTLGRLLAFAAVDTVAAGLCLWVLILPEAGVPLAMLLPVFLIAFGAGLVSGAPGGMGAFEITLLALLPLAATEPLLAGVLAWRAAYYALPALIALPFLALGPVRTGRALPRGAELAEPPLPAGIEAIIAASRRAEAGLLRQGDKLFLPVTGGGAILARTAHCVAMIGDPAGKAQPGPVLAAVADAARAEGRVACLYKGGARVAVAARQAGWQVAVLAQEVWLNPQEFRLDTPERRQLRRKVRKAEAAGLWIGMAPQALPLREMAEVSRAWVSAHGGERGLSMGRFAPDYVATQVVYLARDGGPTGMLVGFLTLHRGACEWTLDLMRTGADAPDGTMYALSAHAIERAAAEGLARLSLAALPHPRITQLSARLPLRLGQRLLARSDGLTRFKSAFTPMWEPLYIASPTRAGLILAGADLARAIAQPVPLTPDGPESMPLPGLGALAAA